MKYIQKFIQHVPIYLESEPDDRNDLYFNRSLCLDNCCWGVPLKAGQRVILTFERDLNTVPLDFNAGDTIKLSELDGTILGITVAPVITTYSNAVNENGVLKEIIIVKFDLRETTPCGKFLFVITDNETDTVWYSDYVQIHKSTDNLHLLKLKGGCEIGNIPFEHVTGNNDLAELGYEIYLDEEVLIGDPEYIVDELFIENGDREEIPLYKNQNKRYKFDTGYVPEYYSEFLNLFRGTLSRENEYISTLTFKDDSNEYGIRKVVNDIINDDAGCFVNNEFSFIIDTDIIKGCCDINIIPCPNELSISVKSKVETQIGAEALNPTPGDVYVVPANTVPLPSFPDWDGHANEYATWNGVLWTFTVPETRDLILTEDTTINYIHNSPIWLEGFDAVINVTITVPFDCNTIVVTGLIPSNQFAKIQVSLDGILWVDYSGFLSSDVLLAGFNGGLLPPDVQHEFRLVLLDVNNCSIPLSGNTKLFTCDGLPPG